MNSWIFIYYHLNNKCFILAPQQVRKVQVIIHNSLLLLHFQTSTSIDQEVILFLQSSTTLVNSPLMDGEMAPPMSKEVEMSEVIRDFKERRLRGMQR